jgi:Zn-dependent peptidase ImmA (M78 family)/transcriptional regulator with XRE-family HTH domain
MINGNRLRQARELLGWTQTDLAAKLGVKQPTIAQFEGGLAQPSSQTLEAIAEETGFLLAFFERPDVIDFPMGSLLFRAHASVTAKQRMEAYRYAQLLFEIWTHFAEQVNELPIRLPRLREDPQLAARITRAELGFSPDKPIALLLNTIEKNGVVVLGIPVPFDKRDAFSLWAGTDSKKPVVAVSSGRPGDRLHWSVAHELGHLVLHHPIRGSIKDLDKEANQFAAEFLLPEEAMRQEIVPPVTLASVGALKLKWKVAMQAIIRRAYELEIITERTYRYLFEQIGWRGWRTREPASLAVPVEKPRGLREMAELLYGTPVNYYKLSNDTGVGIAKLRSILEAHSGGPNEPVRHEGGGRVISMLRRPTEKMG